MTDPYSDEEIGGLGSGPRYPLRSTADGTFVTRIDYRDVYAAVPGCDDGIGAWMPLTHDQRHGNACIDCHSYYGGFPRRYVGVCDDGPVNVCQSCYEQRLFDHIDHYRPQSGPSCCDHHAGWADAPACDDGESDGLFKEQP